MQKISLTSISSCGIEIGYRYFFLFLRIFVCNKTQVYLLVSFLLLLDVTRYVRKLKYNISTQYRCYHNFSSPMLKSNQNSWQERQKHRLPMRMNTKAFLEGYIA